MDNLTENHNRILFKSNTNYQLSIGTHVLHVSKTYLIEQLLWHSCLTGTFRQVDQNGIFWPKLYIFLKKKSMHKRGVTPQKNRIKMHIYKVISFLIQSFMKFC